MHIVPTMVCFAEWGCSHRSEEGGLFPQRRREETPMVGLSRQEQFNCNKHASCTNTTQHKHKEHTSTQTSLSRPKRARLRADAIPTIPSMNFYSDWGKKGWGDWEKGVRVKKEEPWLVSRDGENWHQPASQQPVRTTASQQSVNWINWIGKH